MNKSWRLIPKILSGEKSVESRWYQTKRAPWGKAKAGDVVFFKNSGEAVVARVAVSEVIQFEIRDISDIMKILKQYGKEICLVENDPKKWGKLPKYCILLRLRDPKPISPPFNIDKTGFGSGAAWITISDIKSVRIS